MADRKKDDQKPARLPPKGKNKSKDKRNKPPAVDDQPAIPGGRTMKSIDHIELLKSGPPEFDLDSDIDDIEKAERAAADYWRTIRGVRTPFTGTPGRGTAIGGHPGIMAAANKRSRSDAHATGETIDPKKRYAIFRRKKGGDWEHMGSASGKHFQEGGRHHALLGDSNFKVALRQGKHKPNGGDVGKSITMDTEVDEAVDILEKGFHVGAGVAQRADRPASSRKRKKGSRPIHDAAQSMKPKKTREQRGRAATKRVFGKSITPLDGPDALVKARAMEPGDIGSINGELVVMGDNGQLQKSSVTRYLTPEHVLGKDGVHQPGGGGGRSSSYLSRLAGMLKAHGQDCEYDDMHKSEVLGTTSSGKKVPHAYELGDAGHLATFSRKDHIEAADMHAKAGHAPEARMHKQRASEMSNVVQSAAAGAKQVVHSVAHTLGFHSKSTNPLDGALERAAMGLLQKSLHETALAEVRGDALDLVKSEVLPSTVRVGACTYTTGPDYELLTTPATKPLAMRQRR